MRVVDVSFVAKVLREEMLRQTLTIVRGREHLTIGRTGKKKYAESESTWRDGRGEREQRSQTTGVEEAVFAKHREGKDNN